MRTTHWKQKFPTSCSDWRELGFESHLQSSLGHHLKTSLTFMTSFGRSGTAETKAKTEEVGWDRLLRVTRLRRQREVESNRSDLTIDAQRSIAAFWWRSGEFDAGRLCKKPNSIVAILTSVRIPSWKSLIQPQCFARVCYYFHPGIFIWESTAHTAEILWHLELTVCTMDFKGEEDVQLNYYGYRLLLIQLRALKHRLLTSRSQQQLIVW